ncbi:hypothetical protein OS493_016035 [Desmophyllum pertusum]|uniref:Uncharacterized protein n=1 Tax=Desmophyllum pertusum TaxID=174260 RepID=A0A9X0A526_9CNID|nr:hypothetical protein OS493_016035 [Desmophyllum pertusum]
MPLRPLRFLSLESVVQSPVPGISRDFPPGMIEMREMSRQSSQFQRNNSEVILHPQPCCSHQTPVTILSSPAASPKCILKARVWPADPIVRVSTGTHDLEAYTRCQLIQAQLQPRMQDSDDSGIEELQVEKRLSIESEIFEEEISLPAIPPAYKHRRVLYDKRKSCPVIIQPSKLTRTMPSNICQAFKGYGVCDEPRTLKKPQRKHGRSTLTFNKADSEVQQRQIAWAE